VAGLVTSFGSGAMTNSIAEIDNTSCILAIGTNTTAAHPVIGQRIRRAARNGTRLIVANPKEIDLARVADLFIQQRPGSDVALLMGMARVIVDEGLTDEAFIEERCEDYQLFRDSLAYFTPERVEEISDVPWSQIQEAARLFATNKPASIFYAMGITQHSHGTDNVMAVANLALLTGSVGKPSTGVNPLRGQNNVQGACDMGALPDVYSGYQRVADPQARHKFEMAWQRPLPAEIGLTHVEIFDAIDRGDIKALYLVGENPLLTEANANHVRQGLEKLDFLVVQDIFLSETARYADVVLPAASFAEKEGTFTNTERRVQRVRRAIPALGSAKPDWWITAQIARRMGEPGFDYSSPAEIMAEIATMTPSYGGITYARLNNGGLQWPCPSSEHPGTPLLHHGHFARPNGKGRFVPLVYRPPAESPDEEYPLLLTTDRSLYHYHSSTLTRRVKGLELLDGQELLKINQVDADEHGLLDGEMVMVYSRRGKTSVRTRITSICPPGVVSMTFHFAESPTNELTNAALDPVAKIPETKITAVRVEKLTTAAPGLGEVGD
jgi:formate dehydrogenase major subunit